MLQVAVYSLPVMCVFMGMCVCVFGGQSIHQFSTPTAERESLETLPSLGIFAFVGSTSTLFFFFAILKITNPQSQAVSAS